MSKEGERLGCEGPSGEKPGGVEARKVKQVQEKGKQTVLSGVLQKTFNFKNVVSEAGKEYISLRIELKTK